jgi:hypothetical protein
MPEGDFARDGFRARVPAICRALNTARCADPIEPQARRYIELCAGLRFEWVRRYVRAGEHFKPNRSRIHFD